MFQSGIFDLDFWYAHHNASADLATTNFPTRRGTARSQRSAITRQFARLATGSLLDRRLPFPYRRMEGLPVIRPESVTIVNGTSNFPQENLARNDAFTSAVCLSYAHVGVPMGRLYNPTTRISKQTLMTKHQLSSSIALIGLLFASVTGRAQQTSYDFVIAGARIVDGTGAPWFIGDIGILDDHIAVIGDLHHEIGRASCRERVYDDV